MIDINNNKDKNAIICESFKLHGEMTMECYLRY
jgi:hypothetical protein